MGIYIPNMSKPKDCSECILADKHLNGLYEAKYYCRLEADYEHCPLIEIPTPHGRLIDADELKYTLKECCIDGDEEAQRWYDIMGIDDGIDDYTIAILEAEE